jgi:hypothetical protein
MTGEVPKDESELTLLRAQNAQLEDSLREARESADRRLIQVELKAEATKAGMVDIDGLKLADLAEITIDNDGNVRGAAALIGRLRRDKPWLFPVQSSSSAAGVPAHTPNRPKLATEMNLEEWREARADLLRRR